MNFLEACNYIKLHPKESPSWVLDQEGLDGR